MNRLRELRKEKKLSLIELSEAVHINKSSIARFETGEVEMKADTLKLFSDYFQVTTDYLLGNTDDRNSSATALDNVDIAFYNQHGIVSDAQKQEIQSFIEFVKRKQEQK